MIINDLFIVLLLPTFVIGASVGSFLNVCIARWPAELSVVKPASRCPNCARSLGWTENIPVFGWLILGGKCRGCRLPISVQYPAVELLVALGWLACIVAFGPTFEALRIAIFGTIMLGVAVTDAKHYLIPDGFTVSGLMIVLLFAVVGFFTGDVSHFAPPAQAFIGACAGAGAITIIGWIAEIIMKREAMGFGDSTLMAVIGAAVGAERALLAIIIGAAVGALFFLVIVGPIVWLKSRRSGEEFAFPEVPFGVFLAPAGVLALLWGNALIAAYMNYAFPS